MTENPKDDAHMIAERLAYQRAMEDSGHTLDGRPDLRLEDRLLEALIREHPERDPAKIK